MIDASPVLVLMGVSGSGKSTIAALLARRLGWDWIEGDDLHPAANIAKMSAGVPLTDDDRWPWLLLVADWIDDQSEARRPGIVTCSALKRVYRDLLRRDNVLFVYLRGSRELIAARMAERHGHFMPTSLLDSQFEALEEPEPDERALIVDIGSGPEEAEAAILAALDGTATGQGALR